MGYQAGVSSSLRHYFKAVAATPFGRSRDRDRADAQDAGR
jgi:hypothetical protein